MTKSLLEAVASDLAPVKPAPLPSLLTLRMIPIAIAVSSVICLLIGMRRDSDTLGPLVTWVASLAQFGLAILLVWIAAHESTPANRLPKSLVYLAAIAAAATVVALAWLTSSVTPATTPLRASPWAMGIGCGLGSTLAGGILVGCFSRVYQGALAVRTGIAGALYGAGAGVAINAGWRLACPISSLSHSIGSHGPALVATVLFGALIGHSQDAHRRN